MASVKLSNSKIRRGGETAPKWTLEEGVNPGVSSSSKNHTISIQFKIPSAGGGITDVSVDIGREDFRHLFEAMIEAGGSKS